MNPNLDPTASQFTPEEQQVDRALRPKGLNDFSGQQKIVNNLEIFIKAAKMREEALDHVLLHGPPGLGKTTLSLIIASEMGANMKMTSGPVLEKAGDLAGLLTNLEEGDVLFIDEIHRLNNVVEEYLYSAMEDYRIDIMIDTGPNARSIQIELSPFTLVGATTRMGLLTAPMRARFGINFHLDYYDVPTLKKIIMLIIIPDITLLLQYIDLDEINHELFVIDGLVKFFGMLYMAQDALSALPRKALCDF